MFSNSVGKGQNEFPKGVKIKLRLEGCGIQLAKHSDPGRGLSAHMSPDPISGGSDGVEHWGQPIAMYTTVAVLCLAFFTNSSISVGRSYIKDIYSLYKNMNCMRIHYQGTNIRSIRDSPLALKFI